MNTRLYPFPFPHISTPEKPSPNGQQYSFLTASAEGNAPEISATLKSRRSWKGSRVILAVCLPATCHRRDIWGNFEMSVFGNFATLFLPGETMPFPFLPFFPATFCSPQVRALRCSHWQVFERNVCGWAFCKGAGLE